MKNTLEFDIYSEFILIHDLPFGLKRNNKTPNMLNFANFHHQINVIYQPLLVTKF